MTTLTAPAIARRVRALGIAATSKTITDGVVRVTVAGYRGNTELPADGAARALANVLIADGYDVGRTGAVVTVTLPEPEDEDDMVAENTAGTAFMEPARQARDAAPEPGTWQEATASAKAADVAYRRAEARREAEQAAAIARAELVAWLSTPTADDRDRAARAAASYTGTDTPLADVIAAALAQYRAELTADLAPALTAYDEASADWSQANDEQDDAPSVKDAETYSERLEEAAHAFAHVVRDLVDNAATPPPAESPTVASPLGSLHDDDARADHLAAIVTAAGIDSAELDDVVHDTGSVSPSEANNGGIPAQVAFLVARLGVTGALQVIEEATGRTLPDTFRPEVTDPNALATAWPTH